MKTKLILKLLLGLVLAGLPGVAGAISVGPAGYTNSFSSQPAAADFATANITGASGDVTNAAGLDAAVASLTAASVSTQLSLVSGTPPSSSGPAVYNDTGKNLQTRPTGVKMSVVLVTLINDSGATAIGVSLSYNLLQSAIVSEQVDGIRVYYSLTGAAGSWTYVPAWSATVAGSVSADTTLSGPWNTNSPLYLLYVDDNGTASPDTANQIANFSIALHAGTGPLTIDTQPQSRTNSADDVTATFDVSVSGATPYFFTWYKEASPISGATNKSFSIPVVSSNDVGQYFVIVSNLNSSVTSAVATLTFIPPVSPTITTQPVSLTVNAGEGASFSVAALGGGLSYQWRKEGVNVAGATNSFQALGKVGTNQAGAYTVVITNGAGSITSSIVGLTVKVPLDGTVVAWGRNEVGQATVPLGLTGVVAIAAGGTRTAALKNDGTVLGWGSDENGLADGPVGLSGVTAIAAGRYHTVALKNDGTVVAWGYDFNGQTDVPVGLSGITAIAAGALYTVALKNDGTVVIWGYNFSGAPTVPAGLSGVTAIASGFNHVVGLKQNGTVVAFGSGSIAAALTIPAGLSGVTAIAAGGNQSMALKSDGTVVAWGDNSSGQTNVPAGLSGVTAIAMGAKYAAVLKNDGTVVAWGDNLYGQTNVPAGLSGVSAIAAGEYHMVALVDSAVTAVQPLLHITRSGGGAVTLNWTGTGYTLQQTATLLGTNTPWADVPGPVTTSPYTTNNPAGSRFFRLRP